MSKQKTFAELNAEKEKIKQQLAQEQHKKQRLENRIAYYERGDRTGFRSRSRRLFGCSRCPRRSIRCAAFPRHGRRQTPRREGWWWTLPCISRTRRTAAFLIRIFTSCVPFAPLSRAANGATNSSREYLLDEHGDRIRDEAGNYVFNAVPTTDWGSPETLEHWRQAWADLCNQKFAEKGLDCRIDHRSYARQGIEQIPTVHEGPSVRAMEAKGVRTDKGDFNRWVRKTNAMLREAKNKIASLLEWLKAVKEELSKPQSPMLNDLLMTYYNNRNKGAYSTKAKTANLQRYADAFRFLQEKQLFTTDDLDAVLRLVFLSGFFKTDASQLIRNRFSIDIILCHAKQLSKSSGPFTTTFMKCSMSRGNSRHNSAAAKTR